MFSRSRAIKKTHIFVSCFCTVFVSHNHFVSSNFKYNSLLWRQNTIKRERWENIKKNRCMTSNFEHNLYEIFIEIIRCFLNSNQDYLSSFLCMCWSDFKRFQIKQSMHALVSKPKNRTNLSHFKRALKINFYRFSLKKHPKKNENVLKKNKALALLWVGRKSLKRSQSNTLLVRLLEKKKTLLHYLWNSKWYDVVLWCSQWVCKYITILLSHLFPKRIPLSMSLYSLRIHLHSRIELLQENQRISLRFLHLPAQKFASMTMDLMKKDLQILIDNLQQLSFPFLWKTLPKESRSSTDPFFLTKVAFTHLSWV